MRLPDSRSSRRHHPSCRRLTDGCSQTQPVCTFRQLASGKSLPPIVFYYGATVVGPFPFKVEVKVSEGGKDNSDGTANNIDTFTSNTISTHVRALSADFVAGHSLAVGRTFSTGGIDCVGAKLPATATMRRSRLGMLNRHGTAVTVPVNAEVTATDVGPTVGTCPSAVRRASDTALNCPSQTAVTSPAASS